MAVNRKSTITLTPVVLVLHTIFISLLDLVLADSNTTNTTTTTTTTPIKITTFTTTTNTSNHTNPLTNTSQGDFCSLLPGINTSMIPSYDEDLGVLSDRVTLFNELKPQVISVDKYASVLIYCVGFPGNILSFIVWVQKRMRHSSGCYLAALALDDFIFLTLHVMLELHMVWGMQPLNMPVFCQVFPILFLAAQYMGPLLVLGFTTERYIAICHPFTREKYCTVRRAKMVIGILVTSALGLSAVQGYFYTMQESPAVNGTYECGPRPEVSINGNTSVLILWNLSIEILTFLLVPLTVLVLNILVICEMRRLSRTEQVTLHGHGQRTSATTVMLLAVSFYLILTTLPVTIAYTLFYEFDYDFTRYNTYNETLNDPLFQRWMTYELVLASIKEFGTTQYAFNIIFYIITGKIFRKELKQLFTKILCGKISLCIARRYTSLRGSFRRDGSRTNTTWVSVNGHTASERHNDTETIV